jgi:hypothetical protein
MTRAALVVVVALAGCGGHASPQPVSTSTPAAARAAGGCPVTAPDGAAPKGFDYGDDALAVVLWPRGRLVAGRLPDGSSYAEIKRDGSIVAKLGWWRGVGGKLAVTGERLDRPAPALGAFVPDGYGATGFQATGVTFPTTGCWKVEGRVGDARLTFVVSVRRR